MTFNSVLLALRKRHRFDRHKWRGYFTLLQLQAVAINDFLHPIESDFWGLNSGEVNVVILLII